MPQSKAKSPRSKAKSPRSKAKSKSSMENFDLEITPQLFDNEYIAFNSTIAKKLGQLYFEKIIEAYTKLFQGYARDSICKTFKIRPSRSGKIKKLKLTYTAEGDLHTDVNSLMAELDFMVR